jgi:ribose-phosphate pyrophosphokinase
MTKTSLHYLPGDQTPAERISEILGITAYAVSVHVFPDKESRVTVKPSSGTVILYATLRPPNEKLWHVAFAASALREGGANRLVLVVPYLCYMRQDKAFRDGQAVSQHIVASFLSNYVDKVLTVDPHLHRINNLQSIFTNCTVEVLSSVKVLSKALSDEITHDKWVLVGPDAESEQWVGRMAAELGVRFVVAQKVRRGDKRVSVKIPLSENIRGLNALIIDDVVSSGGTLCQCSEELLKAGAQHVEAVVVHALYGRNGEKKMQNAGIFRIRSTDSLPNPSNVFQLAPLMAESLISEV